MKVSIGSDHRGIQQRETIAAAITALGLAVDDRGTKSQESCDYPDIAEDVAWQISTGECDMGVLICGTGIGMSIAANKVPGVRAAVCHDRSTAELSRQHNNANILCLAGSLSENELTELVTVWLQSDFEGGRHARRVDKITQIEEKHRNACS